MPPKKIKKGRAGARKRVEDDEDEADFHDEEDLINQENVQQPDDQEQLTDAEKEAYVYKKLTSKNPQAAHNITKYNWKERKYLVEEYVDQLVVHYSVEGNILLQESEEARDQEEFHDKKKQTDQNMLNKINKAIKDSGKAVPHDGEAQQKKSLRNMFNYQERAAMTPVIVYKERGIKTDPPQTSDFSVETTQWKIFDAYMHKFEE